MIERALPGQIIVGDFNAEMPIGDGKPAIRVLDSVDFVDLATRTIEPARGHRAIGRARRRDPLLLDGHRGSRTANSRVRRIVINDKHGITRRVYNAKVNIYRQNAEPILLGIEDRVLDPGVAARRPRAAASAPVRRAARAS